MMRTISFVLHLLQLAVGPEVSFPLHAPSYAHFNKVCSRRKEVISIILPHHKIPITVGDIPDSNHTMPILIACAAEQLAYRGRYGNSIVLMQEKVMLERDLR